MIGSPRSVAGSPTNAAGRSAYEAVPADSDWPYPLEGSDAWLTRGVVSIKNGNPELKPEHCAILKAFQLVE